MKPGSPREVRSTQATMSGPPACSELDVVQTGRMIAHVTRGMSNFAWVEYIEGGLLPNHIDLEGDQVVLGDLEGDRQEPVRHPADAVGHLPDADRRDVTQPKTETSSSITPSDASDIDG